MKRILTSCARLKKKKQQPTLSKQKGNTHRNARLREWQQQQKPIKIATIMMTIKLPEKKVQTHIQLQPLMAAIMMLETISCANTILTMTMVMDMSEKI